MEKIKIVGLQKSYTNRKKESTVALYKCDLLVYPGEKYIIFANDKDMNIGDTVYLNIDINNVEAYNLKNNIKLL